MQRPYHTKNIAYQLCENFISHSGIRECISRASTCVLPMYLIDIIVSSSNSLHIYNHPTDKICCLASIAIEKMMRVLTAVYTTITQTVKQSLVDELTIAVYAYTWYIHSIEDECPVIWTFRPQYSKPRNFIRRITQPYLKLPNLSSPSLP